MIYLSGLGQFFFDVCLYGFVSPRDAVYCSLFLSNTS
jgi:hypothetical protein